MNLIAEDHLKEARRLLEPLTGSFSVTEVPLTDREIAQIQAVSLLASTHAAIAAALYAGDRANDRREEQ